MGPKNLKLQLYFLSTLQSHKIFTQNINPLNNESLSISKLLPIMNCRGFTSLIYIKVTIIGTSSIFITCVTFTEIEDLSFEITDG